MPSSETLHFCGCGWPVNNDGDRCAPCQKLADRRVRFNEVRQLLASKHHCSPELNRKGLALLAELEDIL